MPIRGIRPYPQGVRLNGTILPTKTRFLDREAYVLEREAYVLEREAYGPFLNLNRN